MRSQFLNIGGAASSLNQHEVALVHYHNRFVLIYYVYSLRLKTIVYQSAIYCITTIPKTNTGCSYPLLRLLLEPKMTRSFSSR